MQSSLTQSDLLPSSLSAQCVLVPPSTTLNPASCSYASASAQAACATAASLSALLLSTAGQLALNVTLGMSFTDIMLSKEVVFGRAVKGDHEQSTALLRFMRRNTPPSIGTAAPVKTSIMKLTFFQPVSCLSLRSVVEVVPVHSGCTSFF
jgi:hypothetical protein